MMAKVRKVVIPFKGDHHCSGTNCDTGLRAKFQTIYQPDLPRYHRYLCPECVGRGGYRVVDTKLTHEDIVVADWKDIDGLLEGLAEVLEKRGLVLQLHDNGGDAYIVSVADRKVDSKEVWEVLSWPEVGEET